IGLPDGRARHPIHPLDNEVPEIRTRHQDGAARIDDDSRHASTVVVGWEGMSPPLLVAGGRELNENSTECRATETCDEDVARGVDGECGRREIFDAGGLYGRLPSVSTSVPLEAKHLDRVRRRDVGADERDDIFLGVERYAGRYTRQCS